MITTTAAFFFMSRVYHVSGRVLKAGVGVSLTGTFSYQYHDTARKLHGIVPTAASVSFGSDSAGWAEFTISLADTQRLDVGWVSAVSAPNVLQGLVRDLPSGSSVRFLLEVK